MNERDETNSLTRDTLDERSTPRLDRSTLVGCAGILLVLSLPALLFLPLERLHMPIWVANLVLLLAIGAVVFGGYLLVQVPSQSPVRSHDPNFPLTTTGRSPLLEHPAERSNRNMLLLCGGLLILRSCWLWVRKFHRTECPDRRRHAVDFRLRLHSSSSSASWRRGAECRYRPGAGFGCRCREAWSYRLCPC